MKSSFFTLLKLVFFFVVIVTCFFAYKYFFDNNESLVLSCPYPNLVYNTIYGFYDLNITDYTITQSSCNFSKAGFINITVLDKKQNNRDVHIYYAWSSCNETSCGWETRISSTSMDVNSLYEKLKEGACRKISYKQFYSKFYCESREEYDLSLMKTYSCMAGEFETHKGAQSFLKIIQKSDRCSSWVE